MLAQLDRRIGAPLNRLLDAVTQRLAGDFKNIHEIGLRAPEEDYLALLPLGACYILLFAFPFAPELKQLAQLEQLPHARPHARRQALLQGYHLLLKKHLFCAPRGNRLLSKNAAFGSWLPSLMQVFPDAQMIACVREPVSALSSQLSSVAAARQLCATDPDGSQTETIFRESLLHSYKTLANFTRNSPRRQVAALDQGALKAAPARLIQACMDLLQIPIGHTLQQTLDALPRRHESAHAHQATHASKPGEPDCEFARQIAPDYTTLLQLAAQTKPTEPAINTPLPQETTL
ncbi:MAG: hypothetical protein ACI81V_000419 [Lentimonas sp.]